jgi:hypothetical protein
MADVMFLTMKVILHKKFDIETWNQKEKGKISKKKKMNNVNDNRRDSTINYKGLYMYIQLQRSLKCP